jgi:hypothetical protein
MGSNEIFFNLYNFLRQPKNSKNAQKILNILEFFSPKYFGASRFFEVPKTLRNEFFFNLYYLPKIIRQKEMPNCPKQL